MLIGLSGYAQSGKDSTGKVLVEHHGFTRVAFADALKDVLYDLNPLVWDTDGSVADLADCVDFHGWEWVKSNTLARAYLQRLGVAVREHVSPDAWCNAVMNQVQPGENYVITDVRFPNEALAIWNAGGEVWRIVRDGQAPPMDHVSETALDGYDFEETLVVDDFHDDVEQLDLCLRLMVRQRLDLEER